MSSNGVIRVGVVGTGEAAQTIHLPTLALLSHLYRVTALCDVSPDSLRHSASKFHIAKTYIAFSDMVRDPEVDLVFILTTDEHHAEYTIEAANLGKPVFLEKPMALTLADAHAIIDSQERNQVLIFVGYMRRYASAFLEAKRVIATMKQIDYVRVRDIIGHNRYFVEQSGIFPLKFEVPQQAQIERDARAHQMAKVALGARASNARDVATYRLLASLGSHDLSAMRELIGIPKSCFAASRSTSGLFINALFEYEGFTASYESGIDDVAKFDAHIEVHGDGKRVKVTYDTPYIKGLPITLTILETDSSGNYVERILRPTYKDAYTLELEELYRCLTNSTPCKTTPQDAAQDLLIFDMIIGALRS